MKMILVRTWSWEKFGETSKVGLKFNENIIYRLEEDISFFLCF